MPSKSKKARNLSKKYTIFHFEKITENEKKKKVKMVALPEGTAMVDRRAWKPKVGARLGIGKEPFIYGTASELYLNLGKGKRRKPVAYRRNRKIGNSPKHP
ncbi:MAG: hypothetical protein QT03_C0001G0167 [archaeon GW2011_AR10]|uniref:Uncharacterized protein n=1 Tax=Candidatus Iainarchaeum sp. TaxID=3101447 RepID=A0A7J4IUM9_9ARCH|nr:MAG: hypothetical protein QT03_C0001G0167 [archaeon GW2011_AR10]HIH08494.1 hypothetical protein [Candidatus Diapherotrites archaeon]